MPRFAIWTPSEATWPIPGPIQGPIRHFRPEMERRITEQNGGGLSPMMEAAE